MRVARPQKNNSSFYPDVPQAAWGYFCARIARENRGKIVLAVLDSAAECEFFYPKLKYFLSLDGKPFDVRMLPEPPPSSSSDAAGFDIACERVGTLRAMAAAGESDRQTFVIATAESLFAPAPNPGLASSIAISRGVKISPAALRENLVKFGYYNETLCEARGSSPCAAEL